MREYNLSVPVPMSASKFWDLRNDRGYDHFCANLDGATFEILSEGNRAGRVFVEGNYEYPSYAIVKVLLGLEGATVWSRMEHDPHRYGVEHAATFVSVPNVLGGRIRVQGSCYCLPMSDKACVLHVTTAVTVRIPGLGRVFEATVGKIMVESYAKLPDMVTQYKRTEAYAAFSRQWTQDVGLDATPPPCNISLPPVAASSTIAPFRATESFQPGTKPPSLDNTETLRETTAPTGLELVPIDFGGGNAATTNLLQARLQRALASTATTRGVVVTWGHAPSPRGPPLTSMVL